jgi:hypothetical protein
MTGPSQPQTNRQISTIHPYHPTSAIAQLIQCQVSDSTACSLSQPSCRFSLASPLTSCLSSQGSSRPWPDRVSLGRWKSTFYRCRQYLSTPAVVPRPHLQDHETAGEERECVPMGRGEVSRSKARRPRTIATHREHHGETRRNNASNHAFGKAKGPTCLQYSCFMPSTAVNRLDGLNCISWVSI